MNLSDRIAAAQGPDIQLEAEIMAVLGGKKWPAPKGMIYIGQPYLRSIDAAMSIVAPAMQEHVMREALTLIGPRGFIVGKFTETLARTICEVSMRERGL